MGHSVENCERILSVPGFFHATPRYDGSVALPDISRLNGFPGAALTARFHEIGLTRPFIQAMTERGDDLRAPLEPTREASLAGDAASVLLNLFFCRRAVRRGAVREALGSVLSAAAIEHGLLVDESGEEIVSPLHLRTVRDLFLFSDYLGGEAEAVMGAGETTAILFQAGWPNRRVRRALDLGCGAGTLALLAAAGAGEVVGTDVNPRAVAMARFNASVNGIENAEFREGDVYAPVRGEKFDVILSQPPYYPDPAGAGRTEVFLHGGARGDELPRRVVHGVADHLEEGGRGTVFTSWPEPPDLASDGLRILELRTTRTELHGTRQSLTVIEHAEAGRGWSASFDVAPECWGYVTSRTVDEIIAGQELLRGPEEKLLAASLRLPEGTTALREGSQMLLNIPAEGLLGLIAVDDITWDAASAVHRAADVRSGIRELPGALPVVRRALERGLLKVA